MSEGIKADKLIAGAVILAVFYAARDVVTPLLASFLAAFLMEPVVAAIARKTGRPLAVGVTLIMLAAGCSIGVIFLMPRAFDETKMAAESAQKNMIYLNTTLQNWLAALPEEIKTRAAEMVSTFSGKLLSWGAGVLAAGIGFLGGVASAISNGILFVMGFVFFMIDFPLLKPGLLNLLPHIGWDAGRLAKMDGFISESDSILRAFVRGQIIYAAALGALTALGLCAIRLPYGLTIGLAVGILSLVPYFGVAIGLLLAMCVSFYSKGQMTHLMLTGGVFAVVQFVDAVYLTPKLLGGSVGIHPLLAIIALLAFSQLFGFFGLILAIPLAAITLAALRILLADQSRAV